MELDKAIKSRHAVRSFKDKKPNYEDIIEAIDSATKGPLAGNLPAVKFVLVSDKEKIQELAKAATQPFIAKAHYVVVILSDINKLKRSYDEKAEMYARQQAGAAIENFWLKITELNLATCWVGAFSEMIVKKTLMLPDGIQIEAILPVGYEYQKTTQKKKPNPDTTLYFDKYKNSFMKPLDTKFEPH